jgi:4-amino-4-deoxychorismate lyase
MSRFIESIRVENQKAFLLEMHQKRVNETFAHFGVHNTLDLSKVFKNLELDEDGFFKLKISYDLENNYRTQLIPYALPKLDSFSLVQANQLDYAFKFEDRKEFEKLKASAKTEEIIIVKNNHITDTSFSNLIFLKDKSWFTPQSYLLNGVMRLHLLQNKKIKVCEITLQNLKEFSHFSIINAMNTMEDAFVYPIDVIINLPNNNSYLDL